MAEIDRALCRKAARECADPARITTDPETRKILRTRAQEWLKLAYSEHEARFEQLMSEFNEQQMGGEPHPPTGPVQRQGVQ